MKNTFTCSVCETGYDLEYDSGDWLDWRYCGVHIQDAMPYLSADERELLISGICGRCFDEAFEPVEEEFGAGIWD